MEAASARGGAPRRGTWSAPGRVNLIGEHTDYTGGLCLPFALDRRTVVEASRRDDDRVLLASAGHGEVEVTTAVTPGDLDSGGDGGWAAYPAGVLWALRGDGHEVGGVELRFTSDVPPGSGLSSSHSLEVATAIALVDLHGLDVDAGDLARLVQRAENDFVGAPTGLLDQMASLHGTEGHAVLLDTRDLTATPVPCDLGSAGLALLVVDTVSPHALVDGEYGARRAACHDAERLLGLEQLRDLSSGDLADALGRLASAGADEATRRRVRHVVTENQRVRDAVACLREHREADLGPLLTASHASLRDDHEVSAPRLDATVEAALGAGALGARMVGGGFGGSVIALVRTDALAGVETAVRDRFAAEAWGAPVTLSAPPSRGAGRDA